MHHCIFLIISQGILLTFQKMTWMVLIKSQLLCFKTIYVPKICTCTCTEDVTQITGLLAELLWIKTHESEGICPSSMLARTGLLNTPFL